MNVGVQIFLFAAAHRREEVAEVIAASFEGFNDFAILVESRAFAVAGHHHVAIGAFEDVADFGPLEAIAS